MDSPDPISRLAQWTANAIRSGFGDYLREFSAITARARERFESRDWRGHRRDAYERLGLVSDIVWSTMLRLRTQLGPGLRDKELWTRARALYAESIAAHPAPEIAETFFNSVARRIFATVGVDPEIEFVSPQARPRRAPEPIFRVYTRKHGSEALVAQILRDCPFAELFCDLDGDARAAAEMIDRHFEENKDAFDEVELAEPIFYRGKAAYRVGRIRRGDAFAPFILAIGNNEDGVVLDAVLLSERDARVMFSFTRSYFHVAVERPSQLVEFLKSILPLRRRSELYISIGYNKHGKTELYRELLAHLAANAPERFERAAGDPGMVMIVFTLPSLDLVFKVIRDRIPPPKSTTPEEVKQKYNLVFRQDRAGRLVDAQEFEHLTFDVKRFAPEVLDELISDAASTVRVEGDRVDIGHLYVERRVRPLNLYLREVDEARAREAVIDYGQSIRDLAATNTFPGDLLLKNFGVTRNGRVIFYDYDEMALVTDCRFRDLPTPRDDADEMSAEPWFFVDQHDIFPEEFVRFLGLTPALESALRSAHGELLTASFWRNIQERLRAGEIVDIFPYPQSRRLRRERSAGTAV